jgi:hypothetical protein
MNDAKIIPVAIAQPTNDSDVTEKLRHLEALTNTMIVSHICGSMFTGAVLA